MPRPDRGTTTGRPVRQFQPIICQPGQTVRLHATDGTPTLLEVTSRCPDECGKYHLRAEVRYHDGRRSFVNLSRPQSRCKSVLYSAEESWSENIRITWNEKISHIFLIGSMDISRNMRCFSQHGVVFELSRPGVAIEVKPSDGRAGAGKRTVTFARVTFERTIAATDDGLTVKGLEEYR